MARKSKAEIEAAEKAARERMIERQRLMNEALEAAPVVDANGVKIEEDMYAMYNFEDGDHHRMVRVKSVAPQWAHSFRHSFDKIPERDLENDRVYIEWYRLTSPEQARQQYEEPGNMGVPYDWMLGFGHVESSCHPKFLRVVTDPLRIREHRLREARARVRGIEYVIENDNIKLMQAKRQLADIENGDLTNG